MKVLFDTCVIVDALQSREPFCHDAEALFLAVANQDVVGCVTAKSLTDIYYLMHRYTHSNEASCAVINKLASLFYVVDTMADDVMLGLACEMADFEDAVMATTALRIRADRIVTRNLADYKNSPVVAVSPAKMLEEIGG